MLIGQAEGSNIFLAFGGLVDWAEMFLDWVYPKDEILVVALLPTRFAKLLLVMARFCTAFSL
jgi:hypothetical protein